jgi:hypothetical protein
MHALDSVTYFSWAVSYSPKMFEKLTTGVNTMTNFTSVTYSFSIVSFCLLKIPHKNMHVMDGIAYLAKAAKVTLIKCL